MGIVYKTKGGAAEYAPLAFNMYRGCTFGCRYCYGPATLRKMPVAFNAGADPKENAIGRLQKDVGKLDGTREVLLSFIGDPYQPEEAENRLTRQALKVLMAANIPCTVLTKAGRLAERDLDLLASYPLARLGVSLAWCCDDGNREYWEPGAATVEARKDLLVKAWMNGVKTWVSMEPVIIPAHALELIREMHSIVDFWHIGKLNHFPRVEKYIDWQRFRLEAQGLLEDVGAAYRFKESMKEYGPQ